ncbi:MAG: protein NrnU [Rubrivivax sp. SCN 70-15]|nr:MAG: protein NrnU [Rubrivivax sp. SCN 70-15]
MTAFILGLVIFLGVHSVRIVAEGWRAGLRERLGANAWKGLYSLVAIAGFVLLVWGYAQARQTPVVLWPVQIWARHLAALLVLVAFVLLAAAYVPRNGIKARLHHPMVLAVKVWAFAHLLANNTLVDLLLFGSFLVWAVLDFRAAHRRDLAAGTVYAPGTGAATALTVIVGIAAWAGFAFWAHQAWIGVNPFAR